MAFPKPVPEIPAANVVFQEGTVHNFITNPASYGNPSPIVFWLNLESKAAVDDLFGSWTEDVQRFLEGAPLLCEYFL